MSSATCYQKFLEIFAGAHVRDGFMDNDGDRMLDYCMKMQGTPRTTLTKVRDLKDMGNDFFKQNEFDMATACYDEACKLLSLSLGNFEGEDIQSLSDLAVSLISNMAAAALKLEEYKAAAGMCSMILDTFPRNVKALFRRAVAYIKLKRFHLAELDLVDALAVEPRNKDVLRELDVVKGHLLIKANGKRVLEVSTEDGRDENNKKFAHILTSDVSREVSDSVITEVIENHSDACITKIESVNMEVTEAQNFCAKKSVLEFSKKGGGSTRLRIPAQFYKKLVGGKEVSLYRKGDLSTMTIWFLNVEDTKKRDFIRERRKRKKKRGCRRKREPKMVDMNKDTSPLEVVDEKHDFPSASLSVSSTLAMSSSASSMCDNFSSGGIPNLQDPQHPQPNDPHEPFIFSARSRKCKISFSTKLACAPYSSMLRRYPPKFHGHEKWRIASSKKNLSQGDESPRHNLSTFSESRSLSRKFLRPRGVSVSCRRYFSEAKVLKKRKEMSDYLATSDRPLKKPFLFVNPVCNVFTCSNYVLIKSDSESR